MITLHNKWTSHLKDEGDKEKFRHAVLADGIVLGRLYAILEEFEDELTRQELSPEQYASPSFAFLKADQTGQRRQIIKIKQLLEHLKKEKLV